jgi:hypothetical protein
MDPIVLEMTYNDFLQCSIIIFHEKMCILVIFPTFWVLSMVMMAQNVNCSVWYLSPFFSQFGINSNLQNSVQSVGEGHFK